LGLRSIDDRRPRARTRRAPVRDPLRATRQLIVTLYDKRRDFCFYVKQYTSWHSFLPRSCTLNIGVSQYHRFDRVIDSPPQFCLELGICIVKLVGTCGVPLSLLWQKIKRLIRNPATKYNGGYRPRAPGWVEQRVMGVVNYGLEGPEHLAKLLAMTMQHRLKSRTLQAERELREKLKTKYQARIAAATVPSG
jgi:hypothetical protein